MLFHARSIMIFETAASWSFFLTYVRILRSECRNSGSSFRDAYQRDRQSRFTASRKQIGLTFCPITYSPDWLAACCEAVSDSGVSATFVSAAISDFGNALVDFLAADFLVFFAPAAFFFFS